MDKRLNVLMQFAMEFPEDGDVFARAALLREFLACWPYYRRWLLLMDEELARPDQLV
jgi:hypothetical protein